MPYKTIQNLTSKDLGSILFKETKIAMAFVGLDHKFILTNDELCNLLNYSSVELSNMTFDQISHPNDLEVDIKLFDKVVSGDTKTYTMTKRYITKNGTVFWSRLFVTGLYDDTDELVGFYSQIIPLIPVEYQINAPVVLDNMVDAYNHDVEENVKSETIVSKNITFGSFIKKEWKWLLPLISATLGTIIAFSVNYQTKEFKTEQRFTMIENSINEIDSKLDLLLELKPIIRNELSGD